MWWNCRSEPLHGLASPVNYEFAKVPLNGSKQNKNVDEIVVHVFGRLN